MAEAQPPNVVEGATTGDFEDEQSQKPSSAEDRKAASALASLDDAAETGKAAQNVDQDAVNKAMGGGAASKAKTAAVKKTVKVDAADVSLLVDQLLLPKPKATELLKAHDGDAVKAMKAYVTV
jgi:NACalpha-BTF3-like transcription factor